MLLLGSVVGVKFQSSHVLFWKSQADAQIQTVEESLWGV